MSGIMSLIYMKKKELLASRRDGWGRRQKEKRKKGEQGRGRGMRTAVSLTSEVMGIPCTARWG